MTVETHEKVTARHLKRTAYLYIRQSTIRQVFENTESTKRQYALRQRAVALGWSQEQIVVIDSDLGQSGASAVDREGFQRLVAEVGMGHAGIVLGLEVSRLARNSTDWHRLLEICALSDTLILDEDGIYDPSHFNDRLLLGLKGTMSEAELHVMRARLRGGLLNKARRGDLKIPLPVGFVYDSNDRVVLDPDKQVQESVRMLFQAFSRTGSAYATVKYFYGQNLLFPRRMNGGPRHGELAWGPLTHRRTIDTLHNPRYAGAFCYGRRRSRVQPAGIRTVEALPRDQWYAILENAHPGYISWHEYERVQACLRESAQAHGADRRHGPPREGPALLQGRVICGLCGARMTVRYHRRGEALLPEYVCHSRTNHRHVVPPCLILQGAPIDAAVSTLVVDAMTPMAVDIALAVAQEIQGRLDEADRLRHQRVERAQYDADLARRRYMQVDPSNRLVADSLEADWNAALRTLTEAQEQYERQRSADRATLDDVQRARILALVQDFPALFRDPSTPHRERKRMVGLLIEDVTLLKKEQVTMHVRFRGGASTTLTVPLSRNAWQLRQTDGDVVTQVDALLDHHTDAEVAAILNERGLRTGAGQVFSAVSVQWIQSSAGLKNLRERLRAAGMLTTEELAAKLDIHPDTLKTWRRQGRLQARVCNSRGEWLYYPPGESPPSKQQGRKISPPTPSSTLPPGSTAGGVV